MVGKGLGTLIQISLQRTIKPCKRALLMFFFGGGRECQANQRNKHKVEIGRGIYIESEPLYKSKSVKRMLVRFLFNAC